MGPLRTDLDGAPLVASTVGLLSFVLLWVTAVWGVVLRNSWAATRIKRSTVYGIHQTVALLGLSLGVVHACVLAAVPGRGIGLVQIVVPFTDRLSSLGVGLGVIGAELAIAATASILIQRLIGYSRWKALHSLTYSAFMLIAAHILISTTSSDKFWLTFTVGLASLVTVVLWIGAPIWAAALERRLDREMPLVPTGAVIRVNVNARKCERAGFCAHTAPHLFKLHGNGRLAHKPSVAAEDVEAAIVAAEVCPVRAITLERIDTGSSGSNPMVIPPRVMGSHLSSPPSPSD